MKKTVEESLAYADSLAGCNENQRMTKRLAEEVRRLQGNSTQWDKFTSAAVDAGIVSKQPEPWG